MALTILALSKAQTASLIKVGVSYLYAVYQNVVYLAFSSISKELQTSFEKVTVCVCEHIMLCVDTFKNMEIK